MLECRVSVVKNVFINYLVNFMWIIIVGMGEYVFKVFNSSVVNWLMNCCVEFEI